MKYLLVSLALATVCISTVYSQMIPQCLCTQVAPCKKEYEESVIPCADQCQKYASAVGADYTKLRQCLVQQQPQIQSTMKCVEEKYANSCASVPGAMVKKRYPETLKIAAMSEINSMLSKLGISNEVKGLLSTGKKLFSCMRKCLDNKAGNCAKTLGCGLDLPSDSTMVKNAKQCAVESGFDTPGVQQICQCASRAGVR
uniref:Uncharacterized protein n=1 Tax=Panagrolaimus sp. ES5 TaxID=591445 RepID=A0AC34G3V9_9BILA